MPEGREPAKERPNPRSSKLTEKEIKFCDKYFSCMSKREAAVYAGYVPQHAATNASLLLRKPKIQKYLAELLEEQREKFSLHAERLALELSRIAFSNVFDMIEELQTKIKIGEKIVFKSTADIPSWIKPVVKKIKVSKFGVELELYDKIDAIEKLGRHIGFFQKDNEQLKPTGPTIYLPDNNRGAGEADGEVVPAGGD
jgi:phage terminase small subunit